MGRSRRVRPLTLDDLYDPQRRIDFSGGTPSRMAWLSDTHYVWARPATGGVDWVKVEAATGQTVPLFDAPKMRAAFCRPPGLRAEDVER